MKLLVTLPWMPYPLNDGGKQGSFNMLEALQDRLEMVLVYPVVDKSQLRYEAEMFERLKNVKIHPFYYFRNKGGIKSQFFLFRMHRFVTKRILKQPYLGSPMYDKAYIDFVLDVIKRENIDAVQNEYYDQLFLTYVLPEGIKRVFVQHEIQYINKQRNIAQLNPCPSDLRMLLNKVRQEEICAMNQYNAVITMTETDKQILIHDGVTVPIYPSPSFIPLPESSSFKPCGNMVSFIGGSGHYPNLNGVHWFLDNAWPIVLEKNPRMQLQIIGKWSETHKKDITSTYRNVIFRGFVPDLGEAISGTITVVPILIGSGIRMKILEAVNYFSPFVATTFGAEGLNFESGKECYITDLPQQFAESILQVQSNVDLQKHLAESAYNKLVAEYSAEASSQRRYKIYDKI